MAPVVVDRAAWGAKAPQGRHLISLPTPRLWVHHTASEQHGAQGVRDIQRFHQVTKGWLDIAYSWLIDDDGTIYEGRGTGLAGGHTAGDNSKSHAICLMGNFDHRSPTAAALESLVWLARHGARLDWWYPTLGGHRDAPGASTACPGAHVYRQLPDVRRRVAAPATTIQEDDMTPEQAKQLSEIEDRTKRHLILDRDNFLDPAAHAAGRANAKTLVIGALKHGLTPVAEGESSDDGQGILVKPLSDLFNAVLDARLGPTEPTP